MKAHRTPSVTLTRATSLTEGGPRPGRLRGRKGCALMLLSRGLPAGAARGFCNSGWTMQSFCVIMILFLFKRLFL